MKIVSTLHLIGLSSAIIAGLAHGQVLFTENFESYTVHSNLNGQSGWTVDNTGNNNIVWVENGTLLTGSKVLAGHTNDIGNISFAQKALSSALSPSAITTLMFDAYATTVSPVTQNFSLGFARQGLPNAFPFVRDSQVAYWGASSSGSMWSFEASTAHGSSASASFSSQYDKPVHLGVVVDGPAGMIYGVYDFGSGVTGETPHYTISSNMIASMDAITAAVQYGFGGGEFDNISVQAVPEPATYALMAGLAALIGVVIRWRSRQV